MSYVKVIKPKKKWQMQWNDKHKGKSMLQLNIFVVDVNYLLIQNKFDIVRKE